MSSYFSGKFFSPKKLVKSEKTPPLNPPTPRVGRLAICFHFSMNLMLIQHITDVPGQRFNSDSFRDVRHEMHLFAAIVTHVQAAMGEEKDPQISSLLIT